jgi:hypothetical protein
VDYDADGDKDLFVTTWGPNALYRNDGDGTFRLLGYETYKRFLLGRMRLLPQHPDVPILLAELELSQKNASDALRWYTRGEVLGGDPERIAAGRAYALLYLGDRQRGEVELARMGDWPDCPRRGTVPVPYPQTARLPSITESSPGSPPGARVLKAPVICRRSVRSSSAGFEIPDFSGVLRAHE